MLYTFLCPFFDFDGVEVRLVPRLSSDGRTFYVSRDGTKGCNVMPNGSIKNCNATPTTCPNSKFDGGRKQHYLQFKDALGSHVNILVSHAVYLAWSGKPIPPGHQIHHLNGIVTDNRIENLICLSIPEHRRYDAVQRSLRMAGRLDRMTSAEILEVTQLYVIDHRTTDEIMEYEMTHHMEI